jgi:FkbM family methyltransferase
MKQIELNGIKLFIRDEFPHYDDKWVIKEVIKDNYYHLKPEQVKNKVIVDIGANIGAFSLLCSKWEAKRIIAFEPEPHNFQILQMNIVLNSAKIEAHNQAVSKKGWSMIDNASGHSQIGRAVGIKVEVISLNDIKINKIDLLKCDAEGGEYEIFEDATDKTLNKIDRIIVNYIVGGGKKNPKDTK